MSRLEEIVATLATTHTVGDGEVLPNLLDQVPEPIAQVSADGSYDSRTWHMRRSLSARHERPFRRGTMPSPGS